MTIKRLENAAQKLEKRTAKSAAKNVKKKTHTKVHQNEAMKSAKATDTKR